MFIKFDTDENMYCDTKNINNILAGSSISYDTLKTLVRQSFGEKAWQDLVHLEKPTTLSIVDGLSIEGNTTINFI